MEGQQQLQQSQQRKDAQMVSELHAVMLELDGLSAHLLALASQLVKLSVLHLSTAEFWYTV
jgi:hypothetical protein